MLASGEFSEDLGDRSGSRLGDGPAGVRPILRAPHFADAEALAQRRCGVTRP